jgi:hypothetical protein
MAALAAAACSDWIRNVQNLACGSSRGQAAAPRTRAGTAVRPATCGISANFRPRGGAVASLAAPRAGSMTSAAAAADSRAASPARGADRLAPDAVEAMPGVSLPAVTASQSIVHPATPRPSTGTPCHEAPPMTMRPGLSTLTPRRLDECAGIDPAGDPVPPLCVAWPASMILVCPSHPHLERFS